MASEKLIRLLESLKAATSEGRLHWKETDGENSFEIPLGPAVVQIEEEFGPLGTDVSYSVTIRNRNGKALEIDFFHQGLGPDRFALARDLYTLARNDALKIDTVIDSMMSAIEQAK